MKLKQFARSAMVLIGWSLAMLTSVTQPTSKHAGIADDVPH